MTEFPRSFFKVDPTFKKLFEIIKSKHQVAKHTEKTLYENRDVKDFCEISRVFVMMEGTPALLIHYDVSSWYHLNGAIVKIETIGVYDNFLEYEKARMYQLHSSKNKDIPNLN